jgi:hypothetical protein
MLKYVNTYCTYLLYVRILYISMYVFLNVCMGTFKGARGREEGNRRRRHRRREM